MSQVTSARHDGYTRAVERLFEDGSAIGFTESQLLDRFASRRDEAAFAALVDRHGPMVQGVCRRFLRDPNDVDDAFQAVFLVLARKAGNLRRKDLVANWLYGVACRVAVRSRVMAARRIQEATNEDGGRLEVDSRRPAGCHPADALARDEERMRLHEEVERLPGRYRAPVVACYLEGRTHEEAAALLGCPVGTVKGRLARARDLLRKRLERRGVAAPAAALATALASSDLRAAVPAPLASETVRHAVALAASPAAWMTTTAISSSVRSLTEGAIQAMFYSQLKTLAIPGTIVAAGLLAAGASLAAYPHDAPKADEGPTAMLAAQEESKPSPAAESPKSRSPQETVALLQEVLSKYQKSLERAEAEAGEVEEEAAKEKAAERHKGRAGDMLKELREQIGDDDASGGLLVTFADFLEKAEKRDAPRAGAEAAAEAAQPTETEEPASESAPKPQAELKKPSSPEGGEQAPQAAGMAAGGFGGEGGGGFSGPTPEQTRQQIAWLAAAISKVDDNPTSVAANEALAAPFTLRSGEKSTLGELLSQIRGSLTTSDGKKLPVYVDPVGIQDAGATLDSPVSIDLEDVPLKLSLRLMLKQLGLAYCVRDGVLIISSLEGIQQELLEAQREMMGLHPDKAIMGAGGGGGMGGMGQGFGGGAGGSGMM
ncbi:RNA polymerase sigma factor [Paludisphaera mucosa]|uniref:RNA polymerase sigma factor n=1 Tax=Paludisphaera mucosa TaxID=3030827 RepID=A0ABT6FH92_9BACT|nr:RNA polymerase sigma factor [Paludisphaera mucosa]MDG3006953.1 RNA polymerase sigma factor [Paludisphaera mucosa]